MNIIPNKLLRIVEKWSRRKLQKRYNKKVQKALHAFDKMKYDEKTNTWKKYET
jgi:hypothetical protein